MPLVFLVVKEIQSVLNDFLEIPSNSDEYIYVEGKTRLS